MSTFKHRKSVKKARWSKKIRQKQLFFNIFLNQSPKCAIFSKGNMILIKDRHSIHKHLDRVGNNWEI